MFKNIVKATHKKTSTIDTGGCTPITPAVKTKLKPTASIDKTTEKSEEGGIIPASTNVRSIDTDKNVDQTNVRANVSVKKSAQKSVLSTETTSDIDASRLGCHRIAMSEQESQNDSLIIFSNPEKGVRTRLGMEEYMPNSCSRILLSGLPGSGKRNVILNIIHRMKPKPSAIHLVHCDPNTIEYDCLNELGVPVLYYDPKDFPTIKNIEAPIEEIAQDESQYDADEDESSADDLPVLQNPLVIVDEVTSDQLGKVGAHRFERLVNHVATHRNTTVICSIQSLLNIPAKSRRAFNHIALWKQADRAVDQMAAQRSGIPYEMLTDLFGLCSSPYDFVWIDLDSHHDSCWRYRLDFISPIVIERSE